MKALIFVTAMLAGVWFAACKTTPAPTTPAPPQPKTEETTESRQAPSSETRESGQPGAQTESKPEQTTGKEAGGQPQQAPAEKSQTRPAASGKAGESTAPAAAQTSDERPSEAVPTAESKLEKARDDVQVSEATERKIAAELEQLKKSGNASAEDIRNYEIYHERVQAMVAENRKKVEKMEQAYSKNKPAAAGGSGLPKSSDQTIPETQTEDRVAALDRQLTASLGEFDAMLLKEMETIETQSAAKMRDLAQEAAEAAKRLKEKGIDLGDADAESSDEGAQQEPSGEKGSSSEEKGSDAKPGEGDDTVAASGQPTGQGQGPKSDRGGRYSKEDDDIVARQLREAAENETDPVLKEKLWKEYEDYKRNTQ